MTKTIGGTGRILRAIVGLGLIAIVFVGPHPPWGWLGLAPLGAALIGWRPPYARLGASRRKT